MANIFDISRIETLVNLGKIDYIVMVDSGILMDEPDLDNWKSDSDRTLFILPCSLEIELEHLKNQPDSRQVACRASENFNEICRRGSIIDGIYIAGNGYFICSALPDKAVMESELSKVELLVRSLGRMLTRMIFLVRQIREIFPAMQLVFLTKNTHVHATLQLIGIPSQLFQGFPFHFEPEGTSAAVPSTDWNAVLEKIQCENEKKLVKLELTLTSRSQAPAWARKGDEKDLILAKGKGILHYEKGHHFYWSLLFAPWDFPSPLSRSARPGNEVGAEDINGEIGKKGDIHIEPEDLKEALPAALYKALRDKIARCASPMAYIEDLPTLQEPVSIMKQFLIFEYAFQERKNNGDVSRSKLESLERRLSDPDDLINWAYFWLRGRGGSREEIDISVNEFLHAIRAYWNVGESFKIEIVADEAELPYGQGG